MEMAKSYRAHQLGEDGRVCECASARVCDCLPSRLTHEDALPPRPPNQVTTDALPAALLPRNAQ